MSQNSNKDSNQSNYKMYPKDSFDRFGDDLCQLLLSYLTIEQKFGFECVSKRWQRLVFNKQLKLNIFEEIYNENIDRNVDTIAKLTSKPSEPIDEDSSVELEEIKLSSLEMVLKKLKFTKEIGLNSGIEITGDVIQLITNNCNDLQKFVLGVNYSN